MAQKIMTTGPCNSRMKAQRAEYTLIGPSLKPTRFDTPAEAKSFALYMADFQRSIGVTKYLRYTVNETVNGIPKRSWDIHSHVDTAPVIERVFGDPESDDIAKEEYE